MKIENFNIYVGITPREGEDKNTFLNTAFDYLKDLTSFPGYMENVNSVVEHADGDNSYVHEWEVVIEEAEFQWKQRSTVDRENRQVLFDLLDGDFDYMKGAWKVVDDPVRCTLELSMSFSIGLPIIEDVLGPVLREKLRTNTQTILASIKKRIEGSHENV